MEADRMESNGCEDPSIRQLSHLDWVKQSAANLVFLKTHFNKKPRVSDASDLSCCIAFCHYVKKYYDTHPCYIFHIVWKVDPRTHRLSNKPFFKQRQLEDIANMLNHRSKPQDRISFFPFSHHIVLIASGKIPCDLDHNWSSLIADTFPWPCCCKKPVNALWEDDDDFQFPVTNTSGWVSEPGYATPFQVLPLTTVRRLAFPKPPVYKRRKSRFSDRKGNR